LWQAENAYMQFATNNTERMRIDSVGTTTIKTDGTTQLVLNRADASIQSGNQIANLLITGDDPSAGQSGAAIAFTAGDAWATNSYPTNIAFYNDASGTLTERMRIDASGNLIVSGTATGQATSVALHNTGYVHAVSSHQQAAVFDRRDSEGTIVIFRMNDAAVGSIGVSSAIPYFASSGNGVKVIPATAGVDAFAPCSTTGANRDNVMDCGFASSRWDDIYATNGTIQTSDRNEKQDIAELSDAEQRVAVATKGLLRKFRWKDSVEEKGDEARTHFGIIAQDLQAAFAAEGLDAGDYAMFINSTWTDKETGEERSRMGVRYSELLAFIIAAI
jgi:hypothetical protein